MPSSALGVVYFLAQDNSIVVFVALLREFDLLVRDRLREYDLAD